MKRQSLLIAACCLAAVSLGGNIWLLMHREGKFAPAVSSVPPKPHPVLPSTDIDFSGTGLSDDAWKLTSDPKPDVSLDEPIDLFAPHGIAPDPNDVRNKALLATPPLTPK